MSQQTKQHLQAKTTSFSSSDSFFKADDDEFIFGSDNDDAFETVQEPHSTVTYHYPTYPSQAKQSPLLSDAPLPPLPASYSPYNSYGYEDGEDQYRSTQFQSPDVGFGSPTFSEGPSEASTTVSPREIFADDHTAIKTYPTLFSRNGPSSSSSTHSPHTPVDEQPFAHPSRLTSLRQESIESYSSYASTSSEDEDVPPTPLMIPEPKAHSHSFPKHVRASSNATTLSPHMAFLATTSNGKGLADGGSSLGFGPLQPERMVEQRYPGREDVEHEASVDDEDVGSPEVAAAAPSRDTNARFDKKRPSPFDEDDDDGDSRYHSSASDDDDDDDEYGKRIRNPRRNSMASQATAQHPRSRKKRVDPRSIRRTSAGASSSATPAPREQSAPPEATCWCPYSGCKDARGFPLGFVRTYDLKRHDESSHASPHAQEKHYCETCNRTFSRKDALIRHLKTIDHTIPVSKRRGPGGGGGTKKR